MEFWLSCAALGYYWAGLANCSDNTQPGATDGCKAFKGCSKPVVYCEIANHGHFPLYDGAAANAWAWMNTL